MLFQFYSKPHYTFIGDNHLMGCSNLSTHKTTLIPAGWIGVLHVASHFAWLREFYLSFLLFFFFLLKKCVDSRDKVKKGKVRVGLEFRVI